MAGQDEPAGSLVEAAAAVDALADLARHLRRRHARLGVAAVPWRQATQNSLPSGSSITMWPEIAAVGLFADQGRPGGHQLGGLRADRAARARPCPRAARRPPGCRCASGSWPSCGSGTRRNPMAGPRPAGSMIEAPSWSSYPGSLTYPSARAQNAAIRCGSAASQPSVQCVAMPARYRQSRDGLLLGSLPEAAGGPGVSPRLRVRWFDPQPGEARADLLAMGVAVVQRLSDRRRPALHWRRCRPPSSVRRHPAAAILLPKPGGLVGPGEQDLKVGGVGAVIVHPGRCWPASRSTYEASEPMMWLNVARMRPVRAGRTGRKLLGRQVAAEDEQVPGGPGVVAEGFEQGTIHARTVMPDVGSAHRLTPSRSA